MSGLYSSSPNNLTNSLSQNELSNISNIFSERFNHFKPEDVAKSFKYFIFYFLNIFCFFMSKYTNLEFISFFLLFVVNSITHYFLAADMMSLEISKNVLMKKMNNKSTEETNFTPMPNFFSVLFVFNLLIVFFSMGVIVLFFNKVNLLFSVLFSNEESLNIKVIRPEHRVLIDSYKNILFANILLIAFIFVFFTFLFPFSLTSTLLAFTSYFLLFVSYVMSLHITTLSLKISRLNTFDFSTEKDEVVEKPSNNYFYPFGSNMNLFSFLHFKQSF